MARYKVSLEFWEDDEYTENGESQIKNFIEEQLNGTAYQAENVTVEVMEEE